jgi:hypothetical protein
MRHPLGHVTSQEEYFHWLDVELIDKMRACERRQNLADASQISDPIILAALVRLGYSPTTVPLLYLVPLVQVAWADGAVSDAERFCIAACANRQGVREDTPAYQQLMAWLDRQPPRGFLEGSLRVVQAALESLPTKDREARLDVLKGSCVDVAAATGSIFGRICAAERKVLAEIQRALWSPTGRWRHKRGVKGRQG